MSSIDQKEYLKRYLSGGDADEKKKKKRRKKRPDNVPAVKMPRSVIVDDDVDVRGLVPANAEDKSSLLEEADEAPLVAAFVDERPEDEVELEQYRTSDKWKTLGDDDKTSLSGLSSQQRRSRHDSSSDASPPRRRQRHDSDSDISPPRPTQQVPGRRQRHDSDSDASPPRRNLEQTRGSQKTSNKRHDSNSDLSPQREKSGRSKGRHDLDSDNSPPRKRADKRDDRAGKGRSTRRHDSDSDLSPLRGKGQSRSSRNEDVRTKVRRHDGDSEDLSPPRPTKGGSNKTRRSRHDSDSDLSPERSSRTGSIPKSQRSKHAARHNSDSDLSPPRGQMSKVRGQGRKRNDSDSDLSPQRSRHQVPRGKGGRKDSDSDLSPDRGKKSKGTSKPTTTMAGAKAGLSDAATLRQENEATRRRTHEAYTSLNDDVSGRNAETVFRDKTGRRRDLKSEKKSQREAEAKQAEEDEKFMQWGKGLVQMKQQKDNVEDTLKEMAKPLARYKNDEDLDQMLKEKDRDGDPMLAFLRKKESKILSKAGIKEKPKYKGPKPAPNRFNIQPGYRWDGVDRSNGFEAKYFKRIADKKATSEIAYKWSIEDM